MWFAPGLGLVRLLFVDNQQTPTDVVLVEHSPKSKAAEFLPLEPGRWWRYQWPAFGGALMTETWRVAGATGSEAMIGCAVHSHKSRSSEARRHRTLTTKYLERSADKKLQAIGVLRSSGSDPAKLRKAARLAGEAGEPGLQGRALHSLAWHYEGEKQPDKALKTRERMLLALWPSCHSSASNSVALSASRTDRPTGRAWVSFPAG